MASGLRRWLCSDAAERLGLDHGLSAALMNLASAVVQAPSTERLQ